MVGKEKPIDKVKNDNLVADSKSVIYVKQENILLSPSSSHSSETSELSGTAQSFSPCDQKAILQKYEDISETTSSNDKLDR
jgi:hypothetical protein